LVSAEREKREVKTGHFFVEGAAGREKKVAAKPPLAVKKPKSVR